MKKKIALVLSMLMCLSSVPYTVLANEDISSDENETVLEETETVETETITEESEDIAEEETKDFSGSLSPVLNSPDVQINSVTPGVQIIDSGTCGENLTWSFEKNQYNEKALVIAGTGPMTDYGWKDPIPWASYASEIDFIVMNDGITYICDNAFENCGSGNGYVEIPESVKTIGGWAFASANFKGVTLHNTVTAIYDSAFSNYQGTIYYNGTWTQLINADVNFNNIDLFDHVLFERCGDNLYWYADDDNNLVIYGSGDMWDFEGEYQSYNPDTGSGGVINSVLKASMRTKFGNIAPWALSNSAITAPPSYSDLQFDTEDGEITYVGDYAFFTTGFASGTVIELPASLNNIGYAAFALNDPVVYTVAEGNANFSAENGVLFDHDKTRLIRYPKNGHQSSGDNSSYDIPDTVTTIDDYAFFNCHTLKSLGLPRQVQDIGNNAFDTMWVRKLNVTYTGTASERADINIDWDMNLVLRDAQFTYLNQLIDYAWTIDDGVLTISGKGDMPDYNENPAPWYDRTSEITTVRIERGISSIGENAFNGCTNLKDLYLPRYIESAKASAFTGVSLDHVYYAGKTTEYNGENVPFSENIVQFTHCGDDATWDLTDGVLTISGTGAIWDEEDFSIHTMPWWRNGKPLVTKVQIEEGVTGLGDRVFGDLDITSLSIPDSLTDIGYNPIAGCNSLTRFSGNNSYFLSYGSELYSDDMTKLIAVAPARRSTFYNVREGVTTIGSGAFDGWMDSDKPGDAFATIYLPRVLKTIEPYAFACKDPDNSSMKNVIFPGTFEEWIGIQWGEGNDALRKGLNEAGVPYFAACGEKVGWDYTEKTKTLLIFGSGPMWDFTYPESSGGDAPILSVVDKMSSGISIMSQTPQGGEPIEPKSIFGNIQTPWAMAGYTDIEKVVIVDDTYDHNNNVTKIGLNAFNIETLQSVTIPASVTVIEGDIFAGDSKTVDIFYAGTEEDRNNSDLRYCDYGVNWHYNMLNVDIYDGHICDFTVTRKDNGQVLEHQTPVEKDTVLTITAVPKVGYKLKADVPNEVTVDESTYIDEYVYVQKDQGLQNYTKVFQKPDTSTSDLFVLSTDETEQSELVQKIDTARAMNQEIRVDLQGETKQEEEIVSTEQNLVNNIVTDPEAVRDYFDINLTLSTKEQELAKVAETANPIPVSLPLSEDAQAAMAGGDGHVKIVRVHDNEIKLLDGEVTDDGYVTFETDKFSTYAIVYGSNGDPTAHDHVDVNHDMHCDRCFERIGYRVTLYSRIAGTNLTVANLQGGDEYLFDAEGATPEVTINAPERPGYQFRGWYKGDSSGYGEELFIEQNNYTFTPEEDLNLWAVYGSDGEVTVNVTGVGGKFVISGNDAAQSAVTRTVASGSTVTLTYVDIPDYQFLYWKNSSGKILSKEKTYEFNAINNADIELHAVETGDNAGNNAFVEYISYYNQIMEAETYSANAEIREPAGPTRYGYTFKNWQYSPDQIRELISNGSHHIVVKPVYEKSSKQSIITVQYKNGIHEANEYISEIGQAVTLIAPEIAGYQFSCWRDESNALLSTAEEYRILTAGDTIITAEYVIAGEEIPEKKPVAALTGYSAIKDGEKNKIIYIMTRSVPEDYTVIASGIIRNKNEIEEGSDIGSILVLENTAAVKVYESTNYGGGGTYTMSLNVGTNTSFKVYARAYVTVKNAEGNILTIYSDNMYGYSFSELYLEQ